MLSGTAVAITIDEHTDINVYEVSEINPTTRRSDRALAHVPEHGLTRMRAHAYIRAHCAKTQQLSSPSS